MKYTLNDAQLAELRQNLMGYAEHPGHCDAFRDKCAACADLIEAALAGQDVKAETAAAIEEIYGPLAKAEIERMNHANDLADCLTEAYLADDREVWKATLKQLLDVLAEVSLGSLMDHIAGLGQSEDAVVMTTDLLLVHDMPAAIQ